MTVTINLPPELENTVRQHAARTGQDVSSFVLQAVQEKIDKAQTIEEICAPFAREVAASNISDQELDELFEEARDEVWRGKQASKP